METNSHIPTATETHLFEDTELYSYEDASNGQRFVNFFVDGLLLRLGLSYATSSLVIELLLATKPELAYEWFAEDVPKLTSIIVSYAMGSINYLFYYTLCEKAFKGYTLGKLISGTRAIRQDGGELTFKDAFLRSLSRLVPFEQFSIWSGNGLWHDAWTKTRVIVSR
jgi:uncharacterized RDD family membrane protein YckC